MNEPTPPNLLPPRDYNAMAEALIADVRDDPPARALRVAGLYAAFFLEEPLIFMWGGIACFVALHIQRALVVTQSPPRFGFLHLGFGDLLGTEVNDALAEANLQIYLRIIPDYLRFRDGGVPTSAMRPGFDHLREADRLLPTDLAGAEEEARRGLVELCRIEQVEVVQPHIGPLTPQVQLELAPFYLFRLGLDSAAPTARFTGDNPVDIDQRWAWTEQEVLPWYVRKLREHGEWLRSDADRLRRLAGVRGDHLPPRWPAPPVLAG